MSTHQLFRICLLVIAHFTSSMMPIDKIPERGAFGPFLQQRRLNGAGVEIGVQRGYFSKQMLNGWKSCTKYVLVDTWKHTANYTDGANVDDNQQEAILALAKKNTKGHMPHNIRHHPRPTLTTPPSHSLIIL